MMTKKTLFSILFLIVACIEIYATIYNERIIELIFKPLITCVLAVLYLVSVSKPNFWFISALFFAFWGDVLLLFPEDYFVLGLVSFLITHLIYIKMIVKYLPKIKTTTKLISLGIFLLYFSGIIYVIMDNLKELFIPVIVYGLIISTFGTVSLLNYIKNKATENLWLLIGALIFILSDSVLALYKFYSPEPILLPVIMITYITAQFYICKAIIAKAQLEV
ncbi:lysoplasmalogenase [uncultured Tenacibaculum sp.]|uniref:lysoplasmalogenase n=1 Tax=uncultured Tenacibaculum sp. TaxID=174713 RepID=UPI002639DBB8|nr:lysoplasmalogenase [uncultured Tenacibaculum sp.]